jgi:hypothetical protein
MSSQMPVTYEMRITDRDKETVSLTISTAPYCEIGLTTQADAQKAIDIIRANMHMLPHE